jgi:antitoxin YefM
MLTDTTTSAEASANLEELLDRVINNCEVVVIKRHGCDDVALIAADELRGMMETLYLLGNPANGLRLLGALQESRSGNG